MKKPVDAPVNTFKPLPDWLPAHVVAARPSRPAWLGDHICDTCGYDTGSYGHYTQCR